MNVQRRRESNAEHMVVEMCWAQSSVRFNLSVYHRGELDVWELRLHAWLPCIGPYVLHM